MPSILHQAVLRHLATPALSTSSSQLCFFPEGTYASPCFPTSLSVSLFSFRHFKTSFWPGVVQRNASVAVSDGLLTVLYYLSDFVKMLYILFCQCRELLFRNGRELMVVTFLLVPTNTDLLQGEKKKCCKTRFLCILAVAQERTKLRIFFQTKVLDSFVAPKKTKTKTKTQMKWRNAENRELAARCTMHQENLVLFSVAGKCDKMLRFTHCSHYTTMNICLGGSPKTGTLCVVAKFFASMKQKNEYGGFPSSNFKKRSVACKKQEYQQSAP